MTKAKDDAKIDQAAKDSFPASDPPATSGITGPRVDPEAQKHEPLARPKDKPMGERHEERRRAAH